MGIPDVPGAQRREVALVGQHLAHVGLVGLEDDRLGDLGGQDLLGLHPGLALHQLARLAELFDLHVEVQLPQRLHARVGLLLHEAVVEVALVVLVGLGQVGVGLLLGDPGGEVDGHLLVAQRHLQGGLVTGVSQLIAFCCCCSTRRTSASFSLTSGTSVWRLNWCENMIDSTSIPFMAMMRQRV